MKLLEISAFRILLLFVLVAVVVQMLSSWHRMQHAGSGWFGIRESAAGPRMSESGVSGWRLARIRDRCSTYLRNRTIRRQLELDGRPMKSLLASSFLIVDDRHKLIYCSVPKVGCTTFKLLLARSSEAGSEATARGIHVRPYLASLGLHYLNTLSPQGIQARLRNYFKFIVVRHPFDRLLSAYADKFADPERNMMNVTWLRRIAEARFRKRLRRNRGGHARLMLSQFLELIGKDPRFRDRHWQSYVMLCQPCRIRYDYVIRLETLADDIGPVLDRLGYRADAHSKYRYWIGQENSARNVSDKLAEVSRQFSKIRPDIVHSLLKVYHYDMQMFGYTWNSSKGASYLDDVLH